MGRPGLYDELVRLDLLAQGSLLAATPGTDAERVGLMAALLARAGSSYQVTPKAIFFLRHRLAREVEKPPTKAAPSHQAVPSDQAAVRAAIAQCEAENEQLTIRLARASARLVKAAAVCGQLGRDVQKIASALDRNRAKLRQLKATARGRGTQHQLTAARLAQGPAGGAD